MTVSLSQCRGRVVGALACQRDSYLRTLDSEVISCVNASLQTKGQTGFENVSAETETRAFVDRTENEAPSTSPSRWLIECADSVLFPEGGGQPSDYGTISPLNDPQSDPIRITFVQRQGLRCVYHSSQPLPPGTLVRQQVDFRRRWDHMQQHTGQHLLTAIMSTHYDIQTLGWGMGGENDTSYVDVSRKPSEAEMQGIQEQCNETIRNNFPITVETPGNAKIESLPSDYDAERGVIRVVRIGNIDANTCCGTHLSQSSHLSLILLHSTQTIRSAKCRLSFTAGDRAINFATNGLQSLRSIARIVSAGSAPSDVVAAVKRASDASTELKRNETKLLAEIAKYEGERVKADLEAGKNGWVYRAVQGLDFINMVVHEVKESIKDDAVLILASGEGDKGGQVVIIGKQEAVNIFSAKVRDAVVGIKGGGQRGRWQGKVTKWRMGDLEALKKLVVS